MAGNSSHLLVLATNVRIKANSKWKRTMTDRIIHFAGLSLHSTKPKLNLLWSTTIRQTKGSFADPFIEVPWVIANGDMGKMNKSLSLRDTVMRIEDIKRLQFSY